MPFLNPSIPITGENPSVAAGIIARTPIIIDVDSFRAEEPTEGPQMLATPCKGYTLIFPDGKSPHTAYPFALHETLILPWNYMIRDGEMMLFSKAALDYQKVICDLVKDVSSWAAMSTWKE